MSLRSLLSLRCTIVHRANSDTEKDEYGNPAVVETDRTKTRCYMERTGAGASLGTGERSVDRSTTSDETTLVLHPDEQIGPLDQVLVDDEPGVFEVIGQPIPARNPRKRGRAHHLEVRLKRTI